MINEPNLYMEANCPWSSKLTHAQWKAIMEPDPRKDDLIKVGRAKYGRSFQGGDNGNFVHEAIPNDKKDDVLWYVCAFIDSGKRNRWGTVCWRASMHVKKWEE